ncbi:MAG: 2-hydroxyglutaryl-CoA dehydratase [Ruminococcaceae bacterium]|nr:2-hydroxyglutaryl-CoA dehydratase [Oscillospiraceae bacterium]
MEDRILFTKEMKKDYTILLPNMLPMHFKIMSAAFRIYGYKAVLLENDGHDVIECGLKYVHNDTCYPALLVIGQFIDALQSGKYDLNKTAVMMTQTGGGCRASNYIALIRKALKKAGFPQVPVISLNVAGLEKNPGFKISLGFGKRILYGVYYGDLLMNLVNQCRPYEVTPGSTQALADKWVEKLAAQVGSKKAVTYKSVRENYAAILRDFDRNLPRTATRKVRVGIVGEIFVKFAPIGNNHLEDFLVGEGAETVMAGLLDFLMYTVNTAVVDYRLYGMKKAKAAIMRFAYRFLHKKQLDFIRLYQENSSFTPPTDFEKTRAAIQGYISEGVQMGEGWLLTAEMLELIESDVKNVVCTQPFGCLPNHIVGKGMMKIIREHHPGVNLVAIDYDSSASRINQENRLKLMLAGANRALAAEETKNEASINA